MAKSKKILAGDLFEIELAKASFACCRAILITKNSTLFEIYKERFKKPIAFEDLNILKLKRQRLAFINEYSVKKRWKYIGNNNEDADSREYPAVFTGFPKVFWRVTYPDGTEEGFSPDETNYEKLLGLGYVPKTIYAGETIEAFCRGEDDLIFKPLATSKSFSTGSALEY
jgi:hypothetical protein